MTIAELRPHGDRLLVRPDPKVATTEGGLTIPASVLADNPNYFSMTGTVVKLGDGVREDVYQCANHQCQYQCRRGLGERCPICGAVQKLAYADSGHHAFDVAVGDRVVFNRFAGKQIEAEDQPVKMLMMREIEVLGVLTGDERVLPGYQGKQWDKTTSNPGDRQTTVVR